MFQRLARPESGAEIGRTGRIRSDPAFVTVVVDDRGPAMVASAVYTTIARRHGVDTHEVRLPRGREGSKNILSRRSTAMDVRSSEFATGRRVDRSDLDVLLEDGWVFRCFTCGDEPRRLHRVGLQRWPTREDRERLDGDHFRIRRRLVCASCLGKFTYPRAERGAIFISAQATITGQAWCLRQHPMKAPPAYTRETWSRYFMLKLQRFGN
jgi:hypothetical protein